MSLQPHELLDLYRVCLVRLAAMEREYDELTASTKELVRKIAKVRETAHWSGSLLKSLPHTWPDLPGLKEAIAELSTPGAGEIPF